MATLLSCPSCGRAVRARPAAVPGRAWLAVLPCNGCGTYAAYMVTEDGTPRAWIVRTALDDEAAAGTG